MAGWRWELALAIFSAILGAAAGYLLQLQSIPRRQITILATSLVSRTADYAIGEDEKVPAWSIEKLSIKNTGSSALTGLTLELAPAGGDLAYDPRHRQRTWLSSINEAERRGRWGSVVRKRGNNWYVTYPALPKGAVDEIVVTHDQTAEDYDVTAGDPAVDIVIRHTLTDQMPDGLLRAAETAVWWRYALVAVASALVTLGVARGVGMMMMRKGIGTSAHG